jgi:hypothetical protein
MQTGHYYNRNDVIYLNHLLKSWNGHIGCNFGIGENGVIFFKKNEGDVP